jgi:plastocyanin
MMTRWAIAVVFAMGSLGLIACGDDDDDTADDDTETTEPEDGNGDDGGGDASEYVIEALEFSDVTAPAGGTLDVRNESGTPHTVTADDDSFNVSVEADNAATLDIPTEPGDYPFHCEIHSSMTATLTVE